MPGKYVLFHEDSQRSIDPRVLSIMGYHTLGLPDIYRDDPLGSAAMFQWLDSVSNELPDDADTLRAARLHNWQSGITADYWWWNLQAWKITPQIVEVYGEEPVYEWLRSTLKLSVHELTEWLLTEPESPQREITTPRSKRVRKPMVVELNERQTKYLRLIYEMDQYNEYYARQDYFQGYRPGPASEWRWIEFNTGDSNLLRVKDTVFKENLREAGLVDPGTGSTFTSLEERKLIELRRRKKGLIDFTDIKLTRKGRALSRQLWPDYKYTEIW